MKNCNERHAKTDKCSYYNLSNIFHLSIISPFKRVKWLDVDFDFHFDFFELFVSSSSSLVRSFCYCSMSASEQFILEERPLQIEYFERPSMNHANNKAKYKEGHRYERG